ncbi:esterase [Mycobacterium sp. Marseille-P9652]|uniref:esterase n=1 Tax=Mycobacterium sp. Marseille-P9652 TaxID=2654950 RepID=UPI001E40A609|nr:esterase [Mycobacterium sp. Marseille-P9652]
MIRLLGVALAAAWALAGGTAGAQSACADLGGTVDSEDICRGHVTGPNYTLDLSFPVDYPDQQPVADYLMHTRDEWVADAGQYPPHDRPPYLLTMAGRSFGSDVSNTRSLVLDMNQDLGAHPVTSYKAFNYDLGKRAPITFDTLFKPGARPLDVLNPIVERQFGPLPFGPLGADAYQNFGITDDAIVFYFSQAQVLPSVNGPQRVSVPRSELASLLAV